VNQSHSDALSATRRGSVAVAHTAITFEDSFWAPRLQTVRKDTLFYIHQQFVQHEYFEFYQRPWQGGTRIVPYVFWESDFYKWIEAASYSLATHPDPALEKLVDEVITYLAGFQQPDGYLNLWFIAVEPDKRWSNLRDLHELYCAGHLIEAAVAHFQATGKRTLLDMACRYADYIGSVFGDEEGKRRGYCGHQEIELALIKLYRATGVRRYLDLSHYFVEERGKQPHYFDGEARARGEDPAAFWAKNYEYNQSFVPLREQREVVGHAVRAMYFYSAIADLAKELHDETLLQTCERLWQHLSSKRLYLTGGLGSSSDNEGMTADYDLPNDTAYAETCAAIGLVLWGHRMLQLDANHRYADILECALYNGVLSGLALDGKSFFYENPLESQGNHHRQPWFRCACCPPNIARLLASLGGYVYGVNASEIMVHLYVQSTANIPVGDQHVIIQQHTNYPWDGAIQLGIELAEPVEFAINLRIPGWCRSARLAVNGEAATLDVQKGYARIARRWQSGDQITLDLEMPVERVYAHPAIRDDVGTVALQRGPLVYCLESADNAVPFNQLQLPQSSSLQSQFEPALLGGVATITGQAEVQTAEDWADTLYRTVPPTNQPHTLRAIPYYAWANRQPGEMRVWIRESKL
jgi:DUF1680 family protein